MEDRTSFKVILVGEGGVGKSVYLRRLLTSEFRKKYIATLGVEVHPIKLNTNYGEISLKIWDCAGQEKFGGLRDGYYIKSDAVIYMYDSTSKITLKNLHRWIVDVNRICGNIPYALCASKDDITNTTKVGPLPEIDTFNISTKECIGLYEPLVDLMKQLTGHDDLQLKENEGEQVMMRSNL